MENEKQINFIKFVNCRNIKLEDVEKFLQSQGYNWTGYINDDVEEYSIDEFESNTKFYFHKPLGKSFQAFNHFFIWTAPLFNENNHVNCNNNKFVRYIYFGISTFKVFTVVEDKEMPRYLTTKLSKDLSKEWVQFLAKQKEDYKETLIQLMIRRKLQSTEDLEISKEYVKTEKERLDKYLEEKTVSSSKDIESFNTITEWLKELN